MPVHPGRVPYEWLTHLVLLSVAPSDAPSFVVARVLEEVDLALGYSCSYCPDSRSVGFRLAHDDWIKDRTIPFGLAKLWSMSYLGPVRVDPIDRLKPSSPKMCLGA